MDVNTPKFKLSLNEFRNKCKEFYVAEGMAKNNTSRINILFNYISFLLDNDTAMKKTATKRQMLIEALGTLSNGLIESAEEIYDCEKQRIVMVAESINKSGIFKVDEQVDMQELWDNYQESRESLKWVDFREFLKAMSLLRNEDKCFGQ